MVANKPAMARPTIYQFYVGDFVVTNILEGHVQREMHPFTATNATEDEIKAVAAANHLPYPLLEHAFVPTLVDTGDKLIAFDPGFGENAPLPTAGFFNETLAQGGYSVDDVDMVVVTHCHPDHIGNLMTGGEVTFPNAEIVFGRTDFDYWKKGENVSEMRQPTLALFRKVAEPLGERARFIEPDETLVPGITAIDAFGHSAGHMVYHVTSGGAELMLMADTVAHVAVSFANPDWHFAMDDDAATAAASRRRILAMAADGAMAAITFHMPFPSVGYIDRHGDGYRWVPAGYQMHLKAAEAAQ